MRFLELGLLGISLHSVACHAENARCGWGDPKCGIEPTAFCETADAFRPVPGEPQVELGEPIAANSCALAMFNHRLGLTEMFVGRDRITVQTGGPDGPTRALPLREPQHNFIWQICEKLVVTTTDCIPRKGGGTDYYLRSRSDGEMRVGYASAPAFTSNAGRFVNALTALATVAHAPDDPTSQRLTFIAYIQLEGLACLLETGPPVDRIDGGDCNRTLDALGWRE
jgi:hypothetical protein